MNSTSKQTESLPERKYSALHLGKLSGDMQRPFVNEFDPKFINTVSGPGK
jgi:hypothetical protein